MRGKKNLERSELGPILKHQLRQALAVDDAVGHAARKAPADRLDQRPAFALELAHLGVRVEHRDSRSLEHFRRGRLAHADRAGERELDHPARIPRSRSAPSNGKSGSPRMVKW